MQTTAAWRALEWYLLARACACLMPPWTLLARDRVIPDCVLTTWAALYSSYLLALWILSMPPFTTRSSTWYLSFRTSCALSELKRRCHPAHPTYRVKQLISSLTIWYS